MEDQRENPNKVPLPASFGKRFWYLWGPLVIKWIISSVVSSAVMMAYVAAYAAKHQEEFMKIYGSQESMVQFTMNSTEKLMPFLTQIEGFAAFITIPIMFFMFFQDRKREKYFGVPKAKKAPLIKYVGIFVIASALCIGFNNLVNIGNLSRMSETYQQTSESFYSAGFGLQILCLGFLIPLAEELVFRGLIFRRIRTATNFMQASLLSAVVFGAFHGNIIQMMYGVLMGLLFAYVYEKYGSLKAPVFAHMTVNILSVVATEFKFFEWLMEDILRVGIVTVLCGTISATVFVLMQRMESQHE